MRWQTTRDICLRPIAGSAPCGEGVGGPRFNLVAFKDAAVQQGPEEFALGVVDRRNQKAIVGRPLVGSDQSALRNGVEHEDWEFV